MEIYLSVAMEERDAKRCISILKEMLEALSKPWDISSSILYSHIKKKEAFPESDDKIITYSNGKR